jgi:hypothetical protein
MAIALATTCFPELPDFPRADASSDATAHAPRASFQMILYVLFTSNEYGLCRVRLCPGWQCDQVADLMGMKPTPIFDPKK